jgi:hypothetical protein
MWEFWGGILMLAAWAVLQFASQPTSGWIHVALIAGTVLVIRGIALGKKPARS